MVTALLIPGLSFDTWTHSLVHRTQDEAAAMELAYRPGSYRHLHIIELCCRFLSRTSFLLQQQCFRHPAHWW